MRCAHCDTEEADKYVQDRATLRIYCDWCAFILRRICWGD